MKRRFLVSTALVVLVAGLAAPHTRAARAIQGSVGQVSAADGANVGLVGCRVYSALPGGETNYNDNTASCRNLRCLRSYVTNSNLNPGGYVCNQEATQVYNGDQDSQPFYQLVDASMNDATPDHIGYFGLSGLTSDNSGIGSFLSAGCPGTQANNCFGRIDLDDAAPILMNTRAGYGGPAHTIRPLAGLNPIPTVSVNVGSCAAGFVCLSWNDPPGYGGNMRPGTTNPAPPSPLLGVRLYKIFSPTCDEPTGDDPGWTPIGTFDLGQTSTQDLLPAPNSGCSYYALTVRVVGPGDSGNEFETYRVGANSQAVGGSLTAIRIVRFDADYAGHGIVNLEWESGLEGNTQGFYVTRSTSSRGFFRRVSDFIPAEGDYHEYAATDRVAAASRAYVYRLEIIGRDGSVTTSSTASAEIPARPNRARPGVR